MRKPFLCADGGSKNVYKRSSVYIVLSLILLLNGCVPQYGELKLPPRHIIIKYCWETFELGLKDKNDFVKTSTLTTLGRIGSASAAETIASADLGVKPQVTRTAVATLAQMHDSAAFQALLRFRGHSDFFVRENVAMGMVRMRDLYGDTLVARVLKRMHLYVDSIESDTMFYEKSEIQQERREIKTKLAIAISSVDPRFPDPQIALAYRDAPLAARVALVNFIGAVKPPNALTWLSPFMMDSSTYVRSKTAEALGKIASPQAYDMLRGMLRTQRREEVVVNAAIALMPADEVRAVEVLIQAMDTYDEDTQSNILLALGEAKLPESRAKILPLVKSAVTGKGDWVRVGAIGALGLIKDTTTLPLIEAALEDPVDEVREIAVGVLAQMKGETMVDRLKAWAKDDQYSMRSVALAGLGSLRDPVMVEKTVYPVLYNTMKFDPEMMVRVRAAFTLLNIINDRKYTKGI